MKAKHEMTSEAITKIIHDGKLTSLTQVSKALGLGSGAVSGSVSKRIRELVPAVAELLANNKTAKDTPIKESIIEAKPETVKAGKVSKKASKAVPEKKPAIKKPASKAEYPMPDCVPFRPSSGYAKVFAILFAFKDTGISKKDLVSKYMAWSGKPEKNAHFDTHVVCSSKQSGESHRSCAKASTTFFVERENDFLRLHLFCEKK